MDHVWVAAGIALVIVVLGLIFVERLVRRVRPRLSRRLARSGCLLVASIAFFPLWRWTSQPGQSGTWCCLVCGAQEEQLRYAGLVISRAQEGPADLELEHALPYHDWYWRRVRVEHEHQWEPTGCHHVGLSGVSCTMRDVPAHWLFRSLPRVPDQELAQDMVLRLLQAAPDRRLEMARAFERSCAEAGPFTRIAGGVSFTREEFAAEYATWLSDHDLWR